MGITQVPPVPTPTTKGDIVVGTATGPARLPVSTTANQTLLVDSTTSTGLRYGSTTLTTSVRAVTPETHFVITGFTYANPNVVFTTSTNHNFQIGNVVKVNGVTLNGSTLVTSINSSRTITAIPAANQFTVNLGATTPSTYLSGGTASITTDGEPCGYKFINGTHIFFSTQGTYTYSTDAITWNVGQVPCSQNTITGVDWDGTTYAFLVAFSGVYTSTTLAPGSWTNRNTFGTQYMNEIKWCGGSVNRWVAVGSTDTTYNGAATQIYTATSGAVTWTLQTITVASGTNSAAARGIAFDGTNAIMVFKPSGYIYSPTGGGSWTHYDQNPTNSYMRPNPSMSLGWWNAANSRWYGFGASQSQVYAFMSTGSPTTGMNKHGNCLIYSSAPHQEANFANSLALGYLYPDLTNNRFYSAISEGGILNITTWNATPTSISSTGDYFVPTSTTNAPNFLPGLLRSASGTAQAAQHVIGFGNSKWVGMGKFTSTVESTGGLLIYVAE
jgi:hypothetical protein